MHARPATGSTACSTSTATRAGQGRGRDRARGAQRDALGLRARPREPRRHRPRRRSSGAISTATHGTGLALSQHLLADRGDGAGAARRHRARGRTASPSPDDLRAARVGLGALGVIATLTLRDRAGLHGPPRRLAAAAGRGAGADRRPRRRLRPLRVLRLPPHRTRPAPPERAHRRARRSRATPAQPSATEVVAENWVLGAVARLGRRSPTRIPPLSRFVSWQLGESDQAATAATASSPASAASASPRWSTRSPAATRPRPCRARSTRPSAPSRAVGFPIEVRFVAGDDALLSPAHERDTTYIAVHQYQGMAWEGYFRAVEEIMDAYGGPPPLGQAPLPDRRDPGRALPALARLRCRSAPGSTPSGVFRNEYTDRVLGPIQASSSP